MQIEKLRITNANGLVPAGQYFKLVADGLRDPNERETPALKARRNAKRQIVLEALQ